MMGRKNAVFGGVSIYALSLAAAVGAPALAQDDAAGQERIVVTGSRIVQQTGMQTPVPVTAVSSVELNQLDPGNIVEGLAQLPQFYGSETPANIAASWFERGGYGNLDLRGLGTNRTLTLLDGRRVVSSTAFGGVDVNTFPEAMISRVETVTGGASAAYGTDAVAGVVNFILDTDFTGVDAHAQAGVTDRGDAENYEASISYGAELGERAHVLLSAEIFEQDGVFTYDDRDWYQGWGTIAPAPGAPLERRPNVVSQNATFDGIINRRIDLNEDGDFDDPGETFSMHGYEFAPDGSAATPFVNGETSFFPIAIPPARHSITNGGSGDDLGADQPTLYPDTERESFFAYLDYELTNDLTVYGQFIHGRNYTWRINTPTASLHGTPTAIQIFPDNAYLPEDIRDAMIAEGIPSFSLNRMGSSDDIGAGIVLSDDSVMDSYTAGFTLDIDSEGGLFDGWVVDGYFQYGQNEREWKQTGLRVDRIHAAVDAVVDPDTDEIVCRTTLFNDMFAGCEPLNLFGRGNASPEAVDWVIGNDVGEEITTPLFFADTGFRLGETDSYIAQEAKVNITEMEQHLFDISASGEIYEGWGAGPITTAFGASYRQEKIRQIVRDSTNTSSDHEDGHPVLCDSDPEAMAAGLRGVSGPDCGNTVGIQYSKVSNIQGDIQVSEAFGEALVPLIADQPYMEQLTAHLAARWADYSGSGTIWSWKAGLDAQVTNDVRLRATYSRDVRAANLNERFNKTGGSANLVDPRYPELGNINITRFSGGNTEVNPEKADTLTAGFVYQPSFIEGLSISADWYQIEIKDAIGQLGEENVLAGCEAGAPDLCALITRNPDTDRLELVGDLFINVDEAVVSGVDLEAAYRRDIELFGGQPETLSARLFASWLHENSDQEGDAPAIDRAGQTGIQQTDGVAYALPDFKLTANVGYDYGPFSTYVQGRYIAEGTIENAFVEGVDIDDNTVDSALYFDAGVSYEFELDRGANVELFGSVINLTDEDPPVTPYYSAFLGYAQQANPQLFDLLGRRYVAGVRVRF